MKLNAVDWGKILGTAVESYGQYKVVSEQKKALQAQTAAQNAANNAAFFSASVETGGIPKEYLYIGAGLILILLIGGRK